MNLVAIYATKFTLEVREDDFEKAEAILVESLIPELHERGYILPVCVATKQKLDRIDMEKAKESLEKLSEKMLAVAQTPDDTLAGDLATLRLGLVSGVTGYAHGMIHHGKKSRRPREYELLRHELERERNRDTSAGFRLDFYASHSGGHSRSTSVLKEIETHLTSMLFRMPQSIEYTVFQRHPEEPGNYALQTFVAAPGGKRGKDPRDVKDYLRSLVEDLSKRDGASGVLALKSMREGYRRAVRWSPNGVDHHRGNALSETETIGFPDIYEIVTLWNSEAERIAADYWLGRKLSEFTDSMEKGYGGFASSLAELRPRI